MQKDGYRQWLATNGRTAKAINTRTTTLLRLERKLGELGIAETDLDAIWAKDRYRSLNSLLDELLVDTKAGGSKVLILSPATTAPESPMGLTPTPIDKNSLLYLGVCARTKEETKTSERLSRDFLNCIQESN